MTSKASAQSDAALASPERLVERVETQRTLASLVVRLDEPYRATILLRYYEGLSAADIARRRYPNLPLDRVLSVAYDSAAKEVAKRFETNFAKFESYVDGKVKAAAIRAAA